MVLVDVALGGVLRVALGALGFGSSVISVEELQLLVFQLTWVPLWVFRLRLVPAMDFRAGADRCAACQTALRQAQPLLPVRNRLGRFVVRQSRTGTGCASSDGTRDVPSAVSTTAFQDRLR